MHDFNVYHVCKLCGLSRFVAEKHSRPCIPAIVCTDPDTDDADTPIVVVEK